MSAEVLASIDVPESVLHNDVYPKDVHRRRERQPFTSKYERHTRALLRALHHDDVIFLRNILENGVNPNLTLRHSDLKNPCTALHLAIESGLEGITTLLLTRGADCDILDGLGQTPLEIACKKKNFRFMEILILHGASLSIPSIRVACLGLTFYHLMSFSTDFFSDTADLDPTILARINHLSSIILDNGFCRGWNGINCSFAYLNRVYNRDQGIFLMLLQSAHDCEDDIFTQSCYTVLYRRRDADTLLMLHRYGYTQMAVEVMKKHKHVGPGPCRFQILTEPSPLMAMCRIKIRRTLRLNPGRISLKIPHLGPIPVCIQKYLDFLLPCSADSKVAEGSFS